MAEVKIYLDPKQASIEEQVAVKCLVGLKCAGLKILQDLEYVMWWCLRKYQQKNLGVMHGGKSDEQSKIETKVGNDGKDQYCGMGSLANYVRSCLDNHKSDRM